MFPTLILLQNAGNDTPSGVSCQRQRCRNNISQQGISTDRVLEFIASVQGTLRIHGHKPQDSTKHVGSIQTRM